MTVTATWGGTSVAYAAVMLEIGAAPLPLAGTVSLTSADTLSGTSALAVQGTAVLTQADASVISSAGWTPLTGDAPLTQDVQTLVVLGSWRSKGLRHSRLRTTRWPAQRS